MMNVFSIEAQSTIAYLSSLSRPLTKEEMLQGRKAALQLGRLIKEKVFSSANELKAMCKEHYKELGYSDKEALEAMRLDAQSSLRDHGFIKSKRCRFAHR